MFGVSNKNVLAISDPQSVPNNSFGIHIANIQDLADAAKLVNSGGGDWGYVTLVITKDNRLNNLWQDVFNQMRKLHLIPILRIATSENEGNWEKPDVNDIDNWVSFFNSLNWVIKNRYVVVGNEVNSGKEWGGEVNPEEYAVYLKLFAEKLKGANPDYFIISAGFDASLPTKKGSLEEGTYLRRMVNKEPGIFDLVDGWASHSYPNPNFSGSEYASGRGSITTFEWELMYLKNLGVIKDLPVFITETGWAHQVAGNTKTKGFAKEITLSQKYVTAYNGAWGSKNIVAVTPFILNYEFPPFDMFSWKNAGVFNSLYSSLLGLKKNLGEPVQEDVAAISKIFVPAIGFLGSDFTGIFFIENKGQAIWTKDELSIQDNNGDNMTFEKSSFDSLEPGESGFIVFKGKTPTKAGPHEISLHLTRNKIKISNDSTFRILSVETIEMKFRSVFDRLRKMWHPDS